MTRVLITGGSGLLGRALRRTLATQRPEWAVLAPTHAEMDITDAATVERVVRAFAPNVIVHAAAMTAVDRCETQREAARRVNVEGSRHVARAAREAGARLIALSTDCVFDGTKESPYDETDAPEGVTGVYGATKREAERVIRQTDPESLVVRIAWLYGQGGPDFVHAIVRAARASPEGLCVVDDQTGAPTSAQTVAEGLTALIEREDIAGVLHLTAQGAATRLQWARVILEHLGIATPVVPCTTAEYAAPAPRPANSRLCCARWQRLGLPPLPAWEAALRAFLTRSFDAV